MERTIPSTKVCRKCRVEKPASEFTPFKANKDGLFSYCKPCNNARQRGARPHRTEAAKASKRAADRRHYERFRDPIRQSQFEQRLMYRYGITAEDYQRMFEQQGGRCAICEGTSTKSRSERFHVDHDHETGQVRGLLCGDCNRKLGVLENEAWVAKAKEYLAQ